MSEPPPAAQGQQEHSCSRWSCRTPSGRRARGDGASALVVGGTASTGVDVSVTVPKPTEPLNPPIRMKRSVPAAMLLAAAMLVKPEQPPPSSLQVRGTRFPQSPVKISMAVSYVALSQVETSMFSIPLVVYEYQMSVRRHRRKARRERSLWLRPCRKWSGHRPRGEWRRCTRRSERGPERRKPSPQAGRKASSCKDLRWKETGQAGLADDPHGVTSRDRSRY